MRNNLLKFLYLILSLSIMTQFTYCGIIQRKEDADIDKQSSSDQENKIKLKIFTQYTEDIGEKQPFDYAYKKLKSSMPNVELELVIQPQDDEAKIRSLAASGNLPDILQVTSDLIELFKKSNNILQLDQYAKETKIEDRILPQNSKILYHTDGHIYAIPRSGQFTQLIFYNKKVFIDNNVKIPDSYDELLACCKLFNQKGIVPMALFANETWPGQMLYDSIITRTEPMGVSKIDSKQASITEEPYIKAAEKLSELAKKGLFSKSSFSMSADEAFSMLVNGSAAMVTVGSWELSHFAERMGDNVDYLDYFPFADATTCEASRWNRPGGGFNNGYAVNPNSKYKDIAGTYACMLALEFANGRVVRSGDVNPLTNDNVKSEKEYSAIQKKYADDSAKFKSVTVFPWGYKNPKLSVILGDEISKLLTGSYPVDRFVQEANKKLEMR